jgi:DNA (cytosine-5)-methyltransferase 1
MKFKPSAITLFSGGGLADIGLKAAGFEIVGAVERDPKITEWYAINHGNHVVNASVDDVDYRRWEGVDLLHASPPCQSYSTARDKSLPDHEGKDAGLVLLRAIDEINPRWVTIENVEGYRKSSVYRAIVDHLYSRGYWVVDKLVNAKYHGVPQSRKRLIMVASRDGIYQFPVEGKPIGWYAAVKDLLPDCPDTELANWQKRKIEKFNLPIARGGLMSSETRTPGFVTVNDPSFTVTANSGARSPVTALLVNEGTRLKLDVTADCPSSTVMTGGSMRAILLPNAGGRGSSRAVAEYEPSPTIRTGHGHSHLFDATDGMTIKRLTPRCLARLMSVPDDYRLPPQVGLAAKILGNGVPPLMMEAIARQLL